MCVVWFLSFFLPLSLLSFAGDIGAPYQVRITSILGETLTYNGTIPDFVSNKIYRFNQQFTLPAVDSDLDCG